MRRSMLAAMVTLVAAASAACASTTSGTGNGSVGATSTGPTAPAPSSFGATSGPATTTVPGTSTGPSPVEAPPVCASGGCTKNKSADLGDGYTVTLYTGAEAGGAVGVAVLELSKDAAAVFWEVTNDQIAGDLACSPQPKPNCVVVVGVGAHASIATGYVRELNKLVKYDDVSSDTPSTDPVDLNGDGLIDVVTAINTYEPSYATGTVYWQTFQSTGTSFRSTGCTTPQHTLPAEPGAPLTGTCPQ